jgi:hypothetical protein
MHGAWILRPWARLNPAARPSPSLPKSGLRRGDHPRPASSQAPSELHPFWSVPFRCCDLPPQATPPPVLSSIDTLPPPCVPLATTHTTSRLPAKELPKTRSNVKACSVAARFCSTLAAGGWVQHWTSCCPNSTSRASLIATKRHRLETQHRRMRPA